MIESTAVRYFRAVTEGGSIKRAATSLRIAPSAIMIGYEIREDLTGTGACVAPTDDSALNTEGNN